MADICTWRLNAAMAGRRLGWLGAGLLIALAVFAQPVRAAEELSLYERIGGYKGVAATVDHLVDNIYENGTLNANPILKRIHDANERAAFKLILATWVMENTGGPKVYFGRSMKDAHAPLKLSEREFEVIMNECRNTFYAFNVPQKEFDELMTALYSFKDQVVTVKTTN
jgi:hemoglobin